jgi:hypothetical protein
MNKKSLSFDYSKIATLDITSNSTRVHLEHYFIIHLHYNKFIKIIIFCVNFHIFLFSTLVWKYLLFYIALIVHKNDKSHFLASENSLKMLLSIARKGNFFFDFFFVFLCVCFRTKVRLSNI